MSKVLIGGDASNFSGLAGASLLTTTAQFRVVSIIPSTGVTAVNRTFQMANTTTNHGYCLGINQTMMSSGSLPPINVRLHGPSLAIAGATCTAGMPLIAIGNGTVRMLTEGVTATAVSTTAFQNIIGYALENAITVGAEFLIMINPSTVVRTYAAIV